MLRNLFWQTGSAPSFRKAFSHQMWQIKLAVIRLFGRNVKQQVILKGGGGVSCLTSSNLRLLQK